MDNTTMKNRFRKYDMIKNCYAERKTQEDVARKFNISIKSVAKVTQMDDCIHTRRKTNENLREGETIKPIIDAQELGFLDKYDF